MPIYEYRCHKCGEFEVTQRITEPALTRCPSCRGKVTRLISTTSFQLKGSGWYVTDYARKGGKGQATESKTEGKAEQGAGGKTEKSEKSEAKSENKASKSKESAAAA